MNASGVLRKFLFITIWVAIGGGMLVLLIAAMGKQKNDQCRDYSIRLNSGQGNLFLDEKDIAGLLKSAAGKIKGQKKTAIKLLEIEQQLEKNPWIKDAELYFDNKDVLHVSVTERQPIARLFTVTGKSYYMDEEMKRLSLSDKMSALVPVFTGFPEKIISKRDSVLQEQVRSMALFILNSSFWMAQVSQIDITPERNFEMIPVVGNHVVQLGDGENIMEKFHRLFLFYSNVSNQVGFEKYRTINVQYAGQVIGVRNAITAKTDTSQLRMNVERLLREAREMQNDSLIAARALKEQSNIKSDPVMAATEATPSQVNPADPAKSNDNPVLVTNPAPMKPLLTPKAVMPKRDDKQRTGVKK
jgi:cell division protein FtsQ